MIRKRCLVVATPSTNGTAASEQRFNSNSADTDTARLPQRPAPRSPPPEGATSVNHERTIILWLGRLRILLQVMSVGLVLYGMWFMNNVVSHHDDCDMTYSMRRFLPVGLPQNDSNKNLAYNSPYRLYQFFDQRDPRFRTLLSHSRDKTTADELVGLQGCWKNQRFVVVFVPGHGGDYQQARSLGAHGLQMTRRTRSLREQAVLQALRQLDQQGDSETIPGMESFFFPVYALDFREEGTALHGRLVQEQAAFLTRVIHHLANTCNYSSIAVVAHSMGGYAAQLAVDRDASLAQRVHLIITMGTPHAYPIYVGERTLYQLHQHLLETHNNQQETNQPLLISIGGGLRDELIPPASCQVPPSSTSFTLAASSIMTPRTEEEAPSNFGAALGMDHKALVWCHNLLVPIREILHVALSTVQRQQLQDATNRTLFTFHAVQNYLSLTLTSVNDMYQASLFQSRQMLKTQYGIFHGFLVETSFFYNVDSLIRCYLCLGSLYLLFGTDQLVGSVILTAYLTWSTMRFNQLSFLSVLVITVVADGIFELFRMILSITRPKSTGGKLSWKVALLAIILLHIFVSLGWSLLRLGAGEKRSLGLTLTRLLLSVLWIFFFLVLTRATIESPQKPLSITFRCQNGFLWGTVILGCVAFDRVESDIFRYSPILLLLLSKPTDTSDQNKIFGAWSIPMITAFVASDLYLAYHRSHLFVDMHFWVRLVLPLLFRQVMELSLLRSRRYSKEQRMLSFGLQVAKVFCFLCLVHSFDGIFKLYYLGIFAMLDSLQRFIP